MNNKTPSQINIMHWAASICRGITQNFTKLVLITSVILWSLVPSGFMPTLAQNGQITMVICIGTGTVEMTFDSDGHPVEKETETADKTCPFATFSEVVIIPNTDHPLTPPLYI